LGLLQRATKNPRLHTQKLRTGTGTLNPRGATLFFRSLKADSLARSFRDRRNRYQLSLGYGGCRISTCPFDTLRTSRNHPVLLLQNDSSPTP